MHSTVDNLFDLVPLVVKRKLDPKVLAELLVAFMLQASFHEMDILRVELAKRWPKTKQAASKCDVHLVTAVVLAKNTPSFVKKVNEYAMARRGSA